jgi:hypothetical protein
MLIVPFLRHGRLLPPWTSVLDKEVNKDGLRLHLTCNQLIHTTMSTEGTQQDLSIYGYILARLSRSMHFAK